MELKKYIGNKIKEFRLNRGWGQDKLADLLETTKQSVSRYENGERSANQDVLFKLADVFNVSIDDFFPNKEEKLTARDYHYLPTSISAGLPLNVEAITESETIQIPDTLMGKWAGDKDVFIVKANGQSMNKTIPDQSLMAVKPIALNNLKDGDIVIYSENHNYSVKRYYDDKENGRIIFRPHSTERVFIDDIYYHDNLDHLKIHGKVVMYIVNLD